MRLYDYALAAYTRLKEDRRALDFDDLEAGALALLRDHPAARARWQAEVRALLVDEFQDTNARQRDLLALLNGDAGKRFIVGDGKQSIYRFRGADVTVFRAARREIADQGKAFTLDTSYRAHGSRRPQRPAATRAGRELATGAALRRTVRRHRITPRRLPPD